jgi:hypothetical protein
VAKFEVPPNQNDNVGLVIYFQNAGHIPAKFTWGISPPSPAKIPGVPLEFLGSLHEFSPMTRTRLKDGQIVAGATDTIASDSLYIADITTIPQTYFWEIERNTKKVLLEAQYEWCDEFGNYSCREFQLYYQGIPYSAFRVGIETECFTPKPVPRKDIVDLTVCPTPSQRAEEEKWHKPN